MVCFLLLAYCVSLLHHHYSPPLTRLEFCGFGARQPSRILPGLWHWQRSEHQRLFAGAFEQREALLYRLHKNEVLGCTGTLPTFCFRCAWVGMREKCAYFDYGDGWSWTTDLRGCLVETRPTDDFYLYIVNASHPVGVQ